MCAVLKYITEEQIVKSCVGLKNPIKFSTWISFYSTTLKVVGEFLGRQLSLKPANNIATCI